MIVILYIILLKQITDYSTNGTYLNEIKLEKESPKRIVDGDVIRVGKMDEEMAKYKFHSEMNKQDQEEETENELGSPKLKSLNEKKESTPFDSTADDILGELSCSICRSFGYIMIVYLVFHVFIHFVQHV